MSEIGTRGCFYSPVSLYKILAHNHSTQKYFQCNHRFLKTSSRSFQNIFKNNNIRPRHTNLKYVVGSTFYNVVYTVLCVSLLWNSSIVCNSPAIVSQTKQTNKRTSGSPRQQFSSHRRVLWGSTEVIYRELNGFFRFRFLDVGRAVLLHAARGHLTTEELGCGARRALQVSSHGLCPVVVQDAQLPQQRHPRQEQHGRKHEESADDSGVPWVWLVFQYTLQEQEEISFMVIIKKCTKLAIFVRVLKTWLASSW